MSCSDLPPGVLIPDRRLTIPDQPVPIGIGRVGDFSRYVGPTLRMPLPVQRGDSIGIVLRAFREVTTCSDGSMYGTSPQVLTGLQARATIRRAKDHPLVFALTVTVDQTGAGSATRGEITISADATVTRLLPDHGVWDLELNDGTDTLRKTIAEGPVAFNRDVSL
jgi:hypothetical protein